MNEEFKNLVNKEIEMCSTFSNHKICSLEDAECAENVRVSVGIHGDSLSVWIKGNHVVEVCEFYNFGGRIAKIEYIVGLHDLRELLAFLEG